MHARWLGYLSSGLVLVLLACGCQSTGVSDAGNAATAPAEIGAPSDATANLSKTLADAGFKPADLALQTVLTLPERAETQREPVAWKGPFNGSEKASLQATDRILVVARSLDVPQCRFSAPLRMWQVVTNKREKNWQQVLFDGNAKDFLHTAEIDRSSREALGSLTAPSAEPVLPVQLTPDDLRTKLVDVGLTSLDTHIKTEHEDGTVCTPEVRVYVKSPTVQRQALSQP